VIHLISGVGLGKVLAQRIIPELAGKTEPAFRHDSSTNNLIERYRKQINCIIVFGFLNIT
jgi:hypothetical protein